MLKCSLTPCKVAFFACSSKRPPTGMQDLLTYLLTQTRHTRLEGPAPSLSVPRFAVGMFAGMARRKAATGRGAKEPYGPRPSEPGLTRSPPALQIALRRRLRLPLPLAPNRCGGAGAHGCGRRIDPFGDHALACPRTGLLARRAKIVERAWFRVAREAVGPEGQVAPQQLLARTTAPGVRTGDQRCLDLVVYGATSWGGALC